MVSISFEKRSIKFKPDDGKVYFTYDDLSYLPEWPETPMIELTNGEIYLVPSPSILHQTISAELSYLIRTHVKSNDLGSIFNAPIDVVFTPTDTVVPDIIFISNQRKEIIKKQNIQGAPELIIEILSTNRKRDLVEKKEIYKNYKVKEYIIIDPEEEVVLQFNLNNEETRYSQSDFTFKDPFHIKTLENLEVVLSDII
ncbi:MAG: hypothetical protein HeimC2_02020 [Candidatus Heimdallarchaeota archaeon LC_2]|nr:MAG: hypothetical protein HeimC2_02020 [Candidatus Heimdallarchaeota archaeon LC_2]